MKYQHGSLISFGVQSCPLIWKFGWLLAKGFKNRSVLLPSVGLELDFVNVVAMVRCNGLC